VPQGKINVTDPDSRLVKGMRGWLQGYKAQAATNDQQIVVAAEITVDSPDFGHLEPILTAARRQLDAAGVTENPEVVLADAGYWHQDQMQPIVADGIQVLIPPDSSRRNAPRPGWQAGSTRSCAGCSTPTTAARFIDSDNNSSSRCSPTPSSTVAWIACTDEAGPPFAPSGA
jgi:hypothetical protein